VLLGAWLGGGDMIISEDVHKSIPVQTNRFSFLNINLVGKGMAGNAPRESELARDKSN